MSSYNIRMYKDSDRPKVLEIVTSGFLEPITITFSSALRQPQSWLLLLAGLLLPLVMVGSFVLSILGGIGVLLLLWLPGYIHFHLYVREVLKHDMKDIQKFYLQREGNCFWVVEIDGEVVATAGAAIASFTPHEKTVELKRMAVSTRRRGKGIAKLLCRTVFDFARKNRYNAVVLSTTTAHLNGLRLYEKLGFTRTDTDMYSALLRLTGIAWVGYRYDITASR
ncbi:putative N-acetyltransferase 8B [Dendropsophus ebraccatus]|uniref:putative N-acetyltransferase 8B n=1 Tax=Dendropsophus ebraccatus TaxID=150705 RepID=UPI003831A347